MKLIEYKDHTIHVHREGDGMGSMMQPVCSCGWIGRTHWASNDYQASSFNENVKEHFDKIDREKLIQIPETNKERFIKITEDEFETIVELLWQYADLRDEDINDHYKFVDEIKKRNNL